MFDSLSHLKLSALRRCLDAGLPQRPPVVSGLLGLVVLPERGLAPSLAAVGRHVHADDAVAAAAPGVAANLNKEEINSKSNIAGRGREKETQRAFT